MNREERSAWLLILGFTLLAALLYGALLRPALERATRPPPASEPTTGEQQAEGQPTRKEEAENFFAVSLLPVDAASGLPIEPLDRIRAAVEPEGDFVEPEPAATADGALRVDFLPPGLTFTLRVEADGYAPLRLGPLRGEAGAIEPLGPAPLAPLRRLEIELPPAGGRAKYTLRVHRTDRLFRLAGADPARLVADALLSAPPLAEAQSKGGRVVFGDLPAELLALAVEGKDGARARLVDLQRGDVTLRLGPPASGSAAVEVGPGAAVLRIGCAAPPGFGRSITDASKIPDGPYLEYVLSGERGVTARGPIWLEDTPLPPQGALRVRIEGVSVEDARVCVLPLERPALPRRAAAGGGEIVFEHLASGPVRVVAASANAAASAEVWIPAGGKADVGLRLDPSTVVRGRLADEEGRPPEGAVVVSTETGRTAWADRRGRFVLTGLPPGLGRLLVRAVDGAETVVSLAAGAPPVPETVVPLRTSRPLRVRVARPDGSPASGAAVGRADVDPEGRVLRLLPANFAGADGVAVVPAPPPPPLSFVLYASCPAAPELAPVRSAVLSADAVPSEGALGLTLLEGAPVGVRARTAPALAVLLPPSDDPLAALAIAAGRRFRRALEPGELTLPAAPPGGALLALLDREGLHLTPEAGDEAPEPPAARTVDWLEGVVTLPDGSPARGARVALEGSGLDPSWPAETRVDGTGAFRLPPFPFPSEVVASFAGRTVRVPDGASRAKPLRLVVDAPR